MSMNLVELPNLALMLAAISIVVCPILCGMMAYRVSRTY
jgi:hypothetical protein